jgi:hypothetical protein
MSIKSASVSAAIVFGLFLISLPASAVTEREKRDCQGDYHRYCSEYGLGTEGLRACMSRHIKKISNACVAAFVNAGEMTQAQADKLRHKAKTVKKTTTHKKVVHKRYKKKR